MNHKPQISAPAPEDNAPTRKGTHPAQVSMSTSSLIDRCDDHGEAKTVVYRGDRALPQVSSDVKNDPPVAWLMTVSGPGKGHYVTLQQGANAIGYDAASRQIFICTEQPPYSALVLLRFDAEQGRYFWRAVQAPLSDEKPIATGGHVQVGPANLRLVALCDEHFSWVR